MAYIIQLRVEAAGASNGPSDLLTLTLTSLETKEPLTVQTYFVEVPRSSFLQFVSPTNITTAIRVKNNLNFLITNNFS